MRLPLTLLATASLLVCSAQVDINKMMQERFQQKPGGTAGQGNGGLQVQEDNTPFVPNTFIGSYRMEMHMFKKDVEEKRSPMNVSYAFNTDMTAMHIKQPDQNSHDMRMVYDLKNKFQYMLMDDGKKKTAMKQKMKKVVVDTDKQKQSAQMKITVTDEYKEIDGHKCRKITGESADAKAEWWVAQDIDIDMATALAMVETRGQAHDEYKQFGGKGLPMEMTWEKKDGSEKIVMHARDVVVGKADASFFDMSGYEVMDMTNMPGMR